MLRLICIKFYNNKCIIKMESSDKLKEVDLTNRTLLLLWIYSILLDEKSYEKFVA